MYAVGFGNPWIVDVKAAPRRQPAWVAGLAGTLLAVGVLVLARRLGGPAGAWLADAGSALGSPWSAIMAEGGPRLALFGALWGLAAAAARIQGRPPWKSGRAWPIALCAGLTLGAGTFCASVAIAALAGAVSSASGAAPAPNWAALLVGAVLVAFQASAEEVYFRGWLQPVFCAGWGPWLGLAATAALFGGLHLIAGAQGPLAVFNLVLAGLLFGLLALRTGGLTAGVAAHFGWNWTESGALGLEPDPAGSLARLRLAGGGVWNGGADGMNGSPALTLAVGFAVCAVALFGPGRKRA
jgi:membrane protease YdiL (CAAX protease family)